MTIDWNQVRLPTEAPLIDRITFPFWKWWHRSVRETLRLAYWIAFGLAAALVSGLFVAEAVPLGGWGIVAALVIMAGIAGGWLARNGATSLQPARTGGSRMAAVVLALPLALLMLVVATVGAFAVIAFVVVPVVNYGLPMLILVGLGAASVGRLIVRWRRREASRYPPLST